MKNTLTTETMNTVDLVKETLQHAVAYSEYRSLVADHVENKSNTGPEQSEALYQYTLLNDSRMRRLDKTTRVPEEVEKAFSSFTGNQTWLVLTESWCGDAAQSMPMMQKLADIAPNIDFKVALRDEHLELMDQFLTNGGRSIPKLIVIDNDTNEVMNSWGPRPSKATAMAADYKAKHGAFTPEFKQDLQVWYNKDKGENIATDLVALLD